MKNSNTAQSLWLTILLITACLLITFIAYYPGLNGGFAFDDVPNLLRNKDLIIQNLQPDQLVKAALSGISGPLGRPVAMLTFALNHYVVEGFNAYWFKLVNIILHLVNGVSLFLLTLLLLTAYQKVSQPNLSNRYIRLLSLAIMAGWLLHPINLTSVLYVVQRMTSLSAFFVIWGLIGYSWARLHLLDAKPGIILFLSSFSLTLPLAFFSKENGLLLPLFMLVVESTIFRFRVARPSLKWLFVVFFVVTLVLPALGLIISLLVNPNGLLEGYAIRDFDLTERLLTETRALWYYAQLILFPRFSEFGLFHDDFAVSHSLFDPISTSLAVVALTVVLLLAIYSINRAPLIAFGILFFLAGHALESTIFPLELVHEHRNYLPSYGLLFILFYYLLYPLKYLKTLNLRQLSVALYIFILAFITFYRSIYWDDPLEHTLTEVRNHPASPRTNSCIGDVYAEFASKDNTRTDHWVKLARQHFERATELQPSYTDGLFSLIEMEAKLKLPVSKRWVRELNDRLEHRPFAANNINRIANLVICHVKDICDMEVETMVSIIESAQRNPTLKDGMKAELYLVSSKYAVEKLHDHDFGIYFMAQAVAASPKEPRYQLQLARFLILMNRLEDAQKELEQAKRMDILGRYTQEIKEHEDRLNALRQ